MNKRLRTVILVSVLLIIAALLSGCSPATGSVDLNNPPGVWEQFIVYPIAKALVWLSNLIASLGIPYSFGWAIILITIAIKLATLPLTRKQLQSQKAMQDLQPKQKELQEKYGKDRQKLSEEQMKLYKEAGVNPMGGCLPLLIQLPILWGLYQALYAVAGTDLVPPAQRAFFWIPDLFFPTLAVGTNWLGKAFQEQDWAMLFAYTSLPIIMLVTQLIVQKMTQAPKSKGGKDTQAQMMNQMMFFMPIMFGYITLGLPAGLTLYWTVSNILSMIQQYFIMGWGALADWIPSLAPKSAATQMAAPVAVVQDSAQIDAVSDKPVKRNRRRR